MKKLPVIDMDATGKNIEAMRKAAGLSVKDIQRLLGFNSPQAIYKWQRGQSLPSIDNLVALACVLGVGLDDIVIYRKARSETEA